MSKQTIRILKPRIAMKKSMISSNSRNNLMDEMQEESGETKASINNENDEDEQLANEEMLMNEAFYPNAIYCMLNLYNEFYKDINDCYPEDIHKRDIFTELENQMQECFFDFDSKQIKNKFLLLRRQYFNIKSINEINQFEYFRQLHEIYKDPFIEAIAQNEAYNGLPKVYKDENLFKKTNPLNDYQIKQENPLSLTSPGKHHGTTSEAGRDNEEFPIAEFHQNSISNRSRSSSIASNDNNHDLSNEKKTKIFYIRNKTARLEDSPEEYLAKAPKIINVMHEKTTADPNDSKNKNSNMTLAQFNVEQERRHQEIMQKMQQFLDIQVKLFNHLATNKM